MYLSAKLTLDFYPSIYLSIYLSILGVSGAQASTLSKVIKKKREAEKNWESWRLTYGPSYRGMGNVGRPFKRVNPPVSSRKSVRPDFFNSNPDSSSKKRFFFPGSFPQKNLGGVDSHLRVQVGGLYQFIYVLHLCSDFPYGFNLTNPVT